MGAELKWVDNRDIVAFVQQLFSFSSKLNKFSVVWLYNNTSNENPTNHIPKTLWIWVSTVVGPQY